ncbi:MAG: histidine kinase dimerization/phospho-acceptor domain-containing protein, partial [Poseidonibacter sp.]|uniref:histidine kinase dimerization/phospho-acceptor domain-containing protein n=1 Tax=Poseidonibacter sp. TaxID=2321188 RepID=UPI00359CC907
MKYIFLLVCIFSLSFSAEIDTKLSDETQNQSYFKEIEEQINQSKKNDSKNIDIINTEKNHLKHLVEVSSKKISIEEIDFKTVAKNENEVEVIIKALFYSSQTELKIKNQNEVLNNIQNKLTLLKKRISNITEEDKSFLLTYQLQYAYYRIQKKHIETRINLFNENKNKTIAFILNLFAKKISTQNYQTQNEIIKFDENIKKLVQQKTAFELELEKEKKTMILSISHDIKTPLSAIKLYSKALCENLYEEEEKQKL